MGFTSKYKNIMQCKYYTLASIWIWCYKWGGYK